MRIVPLGEAHLACFGYIEDIPVSIRDITITINAFVLEQIPVNLLLGRPYIQKSMMALIQKPSGSVECQIYNTEMTRKYSFLVYKPDERKITRAKALWPEDYTGEDDEYKLLNEALN